MKGYRIITEEEKGEFPFRTRGAKTNVYQEFDKTKITIKQAGIEFNLYDKIQENTEGTDIYETLKKFGTLDSMKKTTKEIYEDVTSLQTLRSSKDLQSIVEKGKNIWQQLPIEERKKFDHDIFKFIDNAEKHYRKELKAELQTQKQEEKTEEKGDK